jgi:potassium efflux system protein
VIEVGISYDSDLDDVIRSLREAADENQNVLKHPEPDVFLSRVGDSSRNMRLRAWLKEPENCHKIHSDINGAIVPKFKENGTQIPFLKRDSHVRSPLPIPCFTREH